MFAECNIKVNAMIDISDGLSSELFHISQQSELGVLIHEEKLPISDEASQMALSFGLDPMVCALNGGEDYELLFTIDQKDFDKVKDNPLLTIIGHIEKHNICYKK